MVGWFYVFFLGGLAERSPSPGSPPVFPLPPSTLQSAGSLSCPSLAVCLLVLQELPSGPPLLFMEKSLSLSDWRSLGVSPRGLSVPPTCLVGSGDSGQLGMDKQNGPSGRLIRLQRPSCMTSCPPPMLSRAFGHFSVPSWVDLVSQLDLQPGRISLPLLPPGDFSALLFAFRVPARMGLPPAPGVQWLSTGLRQEMQSSVDRCDSEPASWSLSHFLPSPFTGGCDSRCPQLRLLL